MDVERRDMDYHVNLTNLDINVLCGYWNPNHTQLPLATPVKGPVEETFSLNCDRSGHFRDNPKVIDHVLFERGKEGPVVTVSAYALTHLLSDREFWVTRYDWENKIWIRRVEEQTPGK